MLEDMENTTQTSSLTPMVALMQYKHWADAELLRAVTALPDLGTAVEGQYVTAIIRHFHTVDCIFRAHLLGVRHDYTSVNPPEPAALSELAQRVAAVDEWLVDYARHLEPHKLAEVLRVKFTDGQERLLSRADILLHVALHGTYHRGNIGVLLRTLGAEQPADGFTTYLREDTLTR